MSETTGRPARILVVDDEEAITTALHRTLRGYEVTVATNGRRALARLAAGERFDVIISDLMMPDLTGFQLFAEIQKIAPALARRIIFITGVPIAAEAAASLPDVSTPVLDKPFSAEQLREAIVELMRR